MHEYFYTEEQEIWIVENVKWHSDSCTLTDAFNERFKTSKNAHSIKAKKKRLLPGHRFPQSGGKPRGEGSSVTAKPIGTESWKGGYLWVKIDNVPLPKNFSTDDLYKNWKQKHVYLWEKQNGKIPNGHVLIFLDGNRNNVTVDNLYCISRKASVYMMRNNMFYSDRELTLTAAKWAELKHQLAKKEERNERTV